MVKEDREAFEKAIATLADMYGKKLTDDLIDAYFSCLKKLDIEQVKLAMHRWCMQSNSKWPTPGNLNAMVDYIPPLARKGVPYYQDG